MLLKLEPHDALRLEGGVMRGLRVARIITRCSKRPGQTTLRWLANKEHGRVYVQDGKLARLDGQDRE